MGWMALGHDVVEVLPGAEEHDVLESAVVVLA
jgi:hypothetical protein